MDLYWTISRNFIVYYRYLKYYWSAPDSHGYNLLTTSIPMGQYPIFQFGINHTHSKNLIAIGWIVLQILGGFQRSFWLQRVQRETWWRSLFYITYVDILVMEVYIFLLLCIVDITSFTRSETREKLDKGHSGTKIILVGKYEYFYKFRHASGSCEVHYFLI